MYTWSEPFAVLADPTPVPTQYTVCSSKHVLSTLSVQALFTTLCVHYLTEYSLSPATQILLSAPFYRWGNGTIQIIIQQACARPCARPSHETGSGIIPSLQRKKLRLIKGTNNHINS